MANQNGNFLTPPNPRYNTYIGARYVPIFAGAWDNTQEYEPLVIVEYQGNSYTSKTFVPKGVEIDNTEFWALTGNYNMQVEFYRQEVKDLSEMVNKGFVNVLAKGVDNTGNNFVDEEIQEIINANKGRTIYFPAGNYKINNTLIFPIDNSYMGFYFDDGARIYSVNDIGALIECKNVSGNANYRKVIVHGGIFDANRVTKECIKVDADARHLTFENCSFIYPTEIAFHDGDANNVQSQHLTLSQCKFIGLEIPFNNTVGLMEYNTDNWFTNITMTGFDIGINLNSTGGHKFENIHIYTGNNARGNQAAFENTKCILDNGVNMFTNLYMDSYFIGWQGSGSPSFANVMCYWSSTISYPESNPIMFNFSTSSLAQIVNPIFRNGNNRGAIPINFYNAPAAINNGIPLERIKISNRYAVDYRIASGQEWSYYYNLYTAGSQELFTTTLALNAGQGVLIGYVLAIAGEITFGIKANTSVTGRFDTEITMRVYETQAPVIMTVNNKDIPIPFNIAFGEVEQHNNMPYYPIYISTNSNINLQRILFYQSANAGTYMTILNNPVENTVVESNTLNEKVLQPTPISLGSNVNGQVLMYNLYNGILLRGSVTNAVDNPISNFGQIPTNNIKLDGIVKQTHTAGASPVVYNISFKENGQMNCSPQLPVGETIPINFDLIFARPFAEGK